MKNGRKGAKYLVIVGLADASYFEGVPNRLLSWNLKPMSLNILCKNTDH